MEKIKISKEEMRRFLVIYQGLGTMKPFVGKEGVLNFFKRVGCIQFDPLNVVGRNPDLVLQSRIDNYSKKLLNDLLYIDRTLVDGWDKMMAIYLTSDWPYFKRLRIEKQSEIEGILRHRNSIEALNYVDEIKEFITKNGAVLASKIDVGSAKKGRWGHGKLSSAAMDYMYNIGIIGISEKKNNQKVYDLIERLLPPNIINQEEPFDNDNDYYKWCIKRRIGSIGIYWERDGGGWIGYSISDRKLRKKILPQLLEEGEILPVEVEGFEKENFYIRKEDIPILNHIGESTDKKVSFLAPLDNLLWDRKLVKDIFDFEYSWEVYIPVAKRKYGYYVLPVLYGDNIIARFEPDMHRGNEPLNIKNWWWEDGYVPTGDTVDKVMDAFTRFCQYLGADKLCEEVYIKLRCNS